MIRANVLWVLVATLTMVLTASSNGQDAQPSGRAGTDESCLETQPAEASEQKPPAFFRLDYSGDLSARPAPTGNWGGIVPKY